MMPQVPSSNGALSSQYIQQQAPQKILTYEEPQPSEYREPKWQCLSKYSSQWMFGTTDGIYCPFIGYML